jgi:hypothetical protein
MSKSETRLLCEDENVRVGVLHSTGSQYFKMERGLIQKKRKKTSCFKTLQKYRTYILVFQFAILVFQFAILLMMIMLYFNGLLPMLFSSLYSSDTNSTVEQEFPKMNFTDFPTETT